jgi:hypothetical protein
MTTTYNTGNPLGSTSPKDLFDNASNLDDAVNGPSPAWIDRFGKRRESWVGIENMVSDFLQSMGFEATHLTYVDGVPLTVLRPTQLIDRAGSVYKVKQPASFPVNLTGTWATDQLLLVDVGDASLRAALIADTGSGLIGFDSSLTYPVGTVGDFLATAPGAVESIFALLSVPATNGAVKTLASYHTGWAASATLQPKGGGILCYDQSLAKTAHDGIRVFSPTVPWDGSQANLAAFLAGTGETLPAGSGCWVRSDFRGTVLEGGARADATTDDVPAFQNALDRIRSVKVPRATYLMNGTLLAKDHDYQMHGESMYGTVLNFTNAGRAWQNNDATNTTRLFCEITNLQIVNVNLGNNYLVDWKSIQHGRLHRVWFLGQQVLGATMLNLQANWTVTECTYNVVSSCYFGNMAIGISIGDGANDCTIRDCRFQPGLTGQGIGILASATAAGRISTLNILDNGFEYPGAITTGINILQNCDNVRIHGNRFEQLANGIVVGAVGNRRISGTNRTDNYFDSCTTNINLSVNGRSAAPGIVAAGTYVGTGSLAEVGNAFGMTGVRTGAGTYAFTYLDTSYPDSAQVVSVQSSQVVNIVVQTPTGFGLTCQNVALAATDAAHISIRVDYNR